jgi:hypothetical protein
MQRKSLAWMVVPAAMVIMVVVTLVLSNYQEEVGIARPGKGGRTAVAAAAEAREAASATGAAGYDIFSKSLAVAMVKARNMPVTNPAETRLRTALTNTIDCLSASREAWAAQLEQSWDPAVDGSPGYWRTLHPALAGEAAAALDEARPGGPLSAEQVRRWAEAGTDHWLQKALALVD